MYLFLENHRKDNAKFLIPLPVLVEVTTIIVLMSCKAGLPCRLTNEAISYIKKGDVLQAAFIIGSAYCLEGIVIEGNRIGRTIGYPTANLKIDSAVLLPANGVYVAMTRLEGCWYKSMVNIGTRPTLNLHKVVVEVFLIGLDSEIYGKTLSVHFLNRIRSEVRFPSLSELKQQLNMDRIHTVEEIDRLGVRPSSDELSIKVQRTLPL